MLHDLPEDQKPCPCCGQMREVIGQATSEQLDVEPAKIKVIEPIRLKYACKACEEKAAEGGPQITTAEKPLAPIEKGLAAPGLLAYVIVSKYGDHLPLYRLENILARHHIEIARSTMCDWAAQSAAALKPLADLMTRELLASKVIHTDDTPVDVLDRTLSRTRTGRFWVYVGDESHPYVVFDYTPNRSRDGPMTFLKNWGRDVGRYLHVDAFGGYDGIYAGEAGGLVTEVACWAHCRRHFFDAQTTDLAIDNNTAENALRRIAIGRKNWLFCGSDNGGSTAAILFSLIASCQRHHIDPFAYLRDMLTRIAAQPISRLAELLPDRWKASRDAAVASLA